MIGSQKVAKLQEEFGKQHPRFTIDMWITTVLNEGSLIGY
jgi:hypothetical protein